MFENKICTFIDILGFKEIIDKADTDNKLAIKIAKVLDVMESCEHLLNDERLKRVAHYAIERITEKDADFYIPQKSSNNIKSTAFSDSLVISSSVDYQGAFNHFLALNLLIHKLLSLGVMSRGAITIGNLFHKKNTVFGKGLVDAYQLENSVSIFPRICATDELILELGNIEPAPGVLKNLFVRDFDGIYMLDYLGEPSLRFASYDDSKLEWENINQNDKRYASRIEITEDNVRSIVNGVGASDYKILAKARWLAKYFNKSMEDKEHYLPNKINLPVIK